MWVQAYIAPSSGSQRVYGIASATGDLMRARTLHSAAIPTLVFVAAGVGGACSDDHLPAGAAPEPEALKTIELRGGCTPGLARPAPGGYAGIVEIPSLGGDKVFVEDT